jgi:hypothetical protein
MFVSLVNYQNSNAGIIKIRHLRQEIQLKPTISPITASITTLTSATSALLIFLIIERRLLSLRMQNNHDQQIFCNIKTAYVS